MAVRIAVNIPERLHHQLQLRARQSGTSMQALIVRAIEQTCNEPKIGKRVTGPMITGGNAGQLIRVMRIRMTWCFPDLR